ncbi:aminotransferase class I/II-fold pyridoxal phosphate-dependent enzyme [Leeia sp. TBRC 13508]|uniref:Putative 8-amino-7-oxononanoate synthase n=1 Tax=Leeia speluncae TaxID=2884804 RepID=A0ABS8D7X0_9NEIS|nr:methionine aminotransferase [Leeia speluncae]MCB6184310.1 aminotransferase class I/II-fold pyridoxal phosphate-dependent enzyme [Leeia speluncae]
MVQLVSKLPEVGTTIFTVMSQLANQHQAINLSQGFPDYPCHPNLTAALAEATNAGHNQYAPMTGVPVLRAAISQKLSLQHGISVNPDTEITITAGATQAIFTVIATVLHAGDEAIIIEPAYDSYAPAVIAQGAVVKRVELSAPSYQIDWSLVEQSISNKTKLLIINNPNNPATTNFSSEDLNQLAMIAEKHDLLVLADEVYEHLVHDDAKHHSVLSHEALRSRSFAIYSFGKTFHATGWKMGYCVAPAALMAEFRKIHQYLVFSVHTPSQYALAKHLEEPAHWKGLASFFAERRRLLADGLNKAGFELIPGQGTYFQLAKYTQIQPQMSDVAFSEWLTKEIGVACIPISAFYASGKDDQVVRFCFAKELATLDKANERLLKLA